MMSDVSEIILQGVEFWSTVCDSEINLNYEEAEVCGACSSTRLRISCSDTVSFFVCRQKTKV